MKKRIAKDLLDIQAVFLKPQDPFTWASGIKSPIYCDNRLTLSYPNVREDVENALAEIIRKEYPTCNMIMGTSTAGIAHAAIVATILGLPMGYVRASSKDHGRQNQIEGKLIDNAKIVVIEDLISTGGSVLDAIAAAKHEGADVIGAAAIFTYELPKADKNFADAGVKLVTLSNYTELIHLAEQEGYINAEGLTLLKKFKDDQENWQN